MCKQPLILLGVIASVLLATDIAGAQSFHPVTLQQDSYNVDIVVGTNAPLALPADITATQGGGIGLGDFTWYEIGFRPAPYNITNGLPHPGTMITDQANSNVKYLMPPNYTTNDAFFMDGGVSTASMVFNTPTSVTNLSFLGSSGGGSGIINYTIHFTDNHTQAGTLTFPDWFNNTPYAYTSSGRVSASGGTDSEGTSNPRLYSDAIAVTNSSTISNIDFTWSSGGHVAIFAVSGNASGSAWMPIAVHNYNEDIIAEAMLPAPVNATMDNGTNLNATLGLNTWFQQGYDPAAPNAGLPAPGATFTSSSQPTHTYQMAPSYATNDAILIDANHQEVNITPADPTNKYSAFAILTAGGNIVNGNTMTNRIILEHADGTAETNLFYGYDWFDSSQPVAFDANGRVDLSAPAFNNINRSYPRLFESVFGLSDTTSPVTNIVVQYDTAPYANSTTYVMAISAATGSVAPAINLQPKEVNVFVGGTAVLNVGLSAGTQPLSFQWQKDGLNLTNSSAISGATSSNLVITGASPADMGNYQLIITNAAGKTASSMIPVTVMSTLPDVTAPGDPVTAYEPSGGSSPAGSGPAMAIDDTTSQFQDYGGNGGNIPFIGPVGFVVTPLSGASVVSGLRIYTADTASVCDPIDYTLEGSSDGVTFTTISSGSLALPDDRNPGGQPLNPTNQFLTEVDFGNATAYTTYRLSFTDVKGPTTADSLRVGEVEFLGTNSPSAPVLVRDLTPLAMTNYAGTPVTLSIQAAGSAPLSYHWLLDAATVADATNASYAFPTVAGVHTYRCTVTNDYGATNSLIVTITGMDATASTNFTVNLNDDDNFAQEYNQNQFNPYVGPGAYPGATANDFWNGFGLESNGNNPYPTNGVVADVVGIPTPITYAISYDGNSGGLFSDTNGPYQGTPGFLFGEAAVVSGTDVGSLTLHNVPSGSYDVYLYGANFDGTRGALFTVNSGHSVNGIPATTNPYTSSGNGPLTTFTQGGDYVEFTRVTPDANGNIAITWSQNLNDNSGGGEGDFNGMSLVRVGAAPPQIAVHASTKNMVISWFPTNNSVLQEATNILGPFKDLTGLTSPYTNSFTLPQEYFRVKTQ